MSKDIIATCPQCGAQGKAGMFCEYCGTKIPMPVKKAKNTPPKDTKKAFSWYNVCPQEYEPAPEAVIGNYKDSLFMAVKSKNDDFFELVRGVINRDGIFVVDPTRSLVELFVDNNDCIVGGELYNLLTGDRFFPDIDYLSYEKSEKYLFSWGGQKPYRIFNRITRTEINLDKPIPCGYNIIEVDANDCIVFSNYRNSYTENEIEVEGDKVDCYVEITGNHGIVTFQTKNEPQKEEPKETIKTETKQPTEAQESKSGYGKTLGCLFVVLFLVILVVVVLCNNYSQQQEAQHQREAEAKKMAELEKIRDYRPASVSVDDYNNADNSEINKLIDNMVLVEGGTFTMGATLEQDSDARDDEKPTHQVTLSSFMIGRCEVTQAQWETVMGSNPSYFKGDNLPVEQVSWDDCQTFIEKLNSLTGKNFRLPTEAEWEYAARGGNKSRGYKYAGSDNIHNINDVAWYYGNSGDKTHAVGTKLPNELGLYDMSGNVWEWCGDWYEDYSSSAQTNPTGATSGSSRVFRGGSWSIDAGSCRVSFRNGSTPGYSVYGLGLRLVLPVQP